MVELNRYKNIFVTSDLHFGHTNIIKLCNRPFVNTYDMDMTLIENWNKVVTKDDLVIIVGDFTFRGQKASYYADKLNGSKILVTGNHDKLTDEDVKCFVHITTYLECSIDKQKYILFHYPILSWNGAFNNSIMLYGHVHSTGHDFEIPKLPNIYNVCCELHGFKPVNIKEFKAENFVSYMLMKKLLTKK